MATRFYLPSSGSPPLASLGVDASWTRSNDLVRLPCDVIKSDTSLTQKSATWGGANTVGWVWAQFQSKCLAAGYSWTTGDTVSMVIKVAEAVPQVDSHLAYSIKVVSQDGSTVRGTIGEYLATSTEYPTSLAAIATRIHNARTNGASNFSSQAGDRIVIEIGHWGVTPAVDVVYHNYGDPVATADYALTADLTTDLCPWVELSQNVTFDNRSSRAVYLVGGINDKDSSLAFLEGANPSTPTSDSTPAYLAGLVNDLESIPAFLYGQENILDSQSVYLTGGINVLDSQSVYLSSSQDTNSSQPVYLSGVAKTRDTLMLQPDEASGVDTWLRATDPNGNYWDALGLAVGESRWGVDEIARTLIKFDLSPIPSNALIQDTILSLYLIANDASQNTRTARCYRVKRLWVETQATWNSWKSGNAWQEAGGFGTDDCEQSEIGSLSFIAASPLNQFYDFSLTPSAVQEWISGAVANNGLLIKMDIEDTDQQQFASASDATAANRPKMAVRWSVPGSRQSAYLTGQEVALSDVPSCLIGQDNITSDSPAYLKSQSTGSDTQPAYLQAQVASWIVNINHETGDLSQYTSTVTDSGDLSVSNDATAQALAGTTYALKCVVDDTNAIYGDKTFTPSTSVLRVRFYVDLNTLTMATNDQFSLMRICQSSGSNPSLYVELKKSGADYQIVYNIVDDASVSTVRNPTVTDEPHYVEVKITRATNSTSADGTMEAYVDGVQAGTTVTGIDNYDRWVLPDRVRLGAMGGIDAGTSGTLYLDELVINDDGTLIGPVSAGTDTSGDSPAFLHGKVNTSAQQPAYLHGQATAPAPAIIKINHETGDLSQYTATVTDSGDLSVTADAALAGTGYGLSCLIDDTTSIRGQKNFDKQAIIRLRFYIDPHSLTMANAHEFGVFVLQQGTSPFALLTHVTLRYLTATGYSLTYHHNNDANSFTDDYFNITDAPHYVEIHLVRATNDTSSDGTAQWWVDGVSQGSWTGIDNYNVMSDLNLRLFLGAGIYDAIDAGTSGTLYLDELVINDTGLEIGPYPYKHAFLKGSVNSSDTQPVYLKGQATAPAQAAIRINHETGDLSQYTSVVDPSGNITASPAAAMAGTGYGLQVVLDNVESIYAMRSLLISSGVIRGRFYFDPNSLAINEGNDFYVLGIYNDAGPSVLWLNLSYANGYRLRTAWYLDSGAAGYGTPYIITDAPHLVEFEFRRATTADSNDGSATLWVDGNQVNTVTNIDYYTRWGSYLWFMRVGVVSGQDTGTLGTIYFDELVVNDTGLPIGPYPYQHAFTHGQASLSSSQGAFCHGGEGETSQLSALLVGSSNISSNQAFFTVGQAPVNWSLAHAFTQGQDHTTSQKTAFALGGTIEKGELPAFAQGQLSSLGSIPGYVAGSENVTGSKAAYTAASSSAQHSAPSYITGHRSDFSSCSGFLKGNLTTAASHSALTFGLEGSEDFQPVYLYGRGLSSSNLSTFLTGSDGATGSIPAYLYGQETPQAALSAYTHGQGSNTANIPAFLYGEDHGQTSQTAYLEGSAVFAESSTPSLLHGQSHAQTPQPVYLQATEDALSSQACGLVGQDHLTSSLPAYLSGGITDLGLQGAFLGGRSGAVSALNAALWGYTPGVGVLDAYLRGATEASNTITAFAAGGFLIFSSVSIHLTGKADEQSTKPCFLYGQNHHSSGLGAYLRGQLHDLGQVASFLSGQSTLSQQKTAFLEGSAGFPISSQPAFTRGTSTDKSTKAAFLNGRLSLLAAQDLYLKGWRHEPSSQLAYLEGRSFALVSTPAYLYGQAETQEAYTAYLRGWNVQGGTVHSYTQGGSQTTSNEVAFLYGQSTSSGGGAAYTHGSSSNSHSVAAFCYGQEQLTAAQDSFLAGLGEAQSTTHAYSKAGSGDTSSKPAFMVGGVSSSIPAYLGAISPVRPEILVDLEGEFNLYYNRSGQFVQESTLNGDFSKDYAIRGKSYDP